MKSNIAARPSVIVIENLKTSCETCIDLVTGLVNSIVSEGVISVDREVSTTVNSNKGKGYDLELSKCRGMKLSEHDMKVV